MGRAQVVEPEDAVGVMEYKERLDFSLDASATGMFTFRRSTGVFALDERAANLFGVEARDITSLDRFLGLILPDDAAMLGSMVRRPAGLPQPHLELELQLPHARQGMECWIAVRAKDVTGQGTRDVIGTVRDITEVRRRDAQVHDLMREVTHRSKNLLAIIQAMARQTVKDSLTAADFEFRFSSRLRGLSFSHELLASHDWHGAMLADLVHGHLQSVLEQNGDRLSISGPPVFIKPEAAQNIGLALNELTSNALRFGALSGVEGNITLEWRIDTDQTGPRWLHLIWNEYSDRTIQPPLRQGFGHKVMERVVARALDGSATMTFAPTGLQWSLRIPVSHVDLTHEDPARG